jgi:hypothetical protein
MRTIVTSFSPNPKEAERQTKCFESWLAQGFDAFCVQGPDEIIPERIAYRTAVTRVDEPGPPRLVHLLRKAKQHGGAILLNSDLRMLGGAFKAITDATPEHLAGCFWLRRWNLAEGAPFSSMTREQWGIDAFALNPSEALLDFFEPLDLRIGRPGWDYVLPFWFLLRGLPLWTLDDPPILLHREHPIRWSHASWEQNTILGARALGIAATVQLQTLSQQLNLEIDRYSKRLAIPGTLDAQG